MQPLFRLGSTTPGGPTPQFIQLAIDNDDLSQLKDIVVSYDVDGNPKSFITDDEWDFSAYFHVKSTNNLRSILRWNEIPDHFCLAVKRLIYRHLFETRRTDISGMSGLYSICRHWVNLAQLCQKKEIPSLASLSQPEMQGKLLDAIKERQISSDVVEKYLSAINLADQYGFIRFKIKNKRKLAKTLCDPTKGNKQTLAIPQALAAIIYRHAINCLEDFYEKRHSLALFFDEYLNLLDDNATRDEFKQFFHRTGFIKVRIFNNNKTPGSLHCTMLYNDILAICGTVIGAVSGMRFGEWYELDSKSYREESFHGITHSLLVGKTSKLNNGIPIAHAWITAPIAKKAIELLSLVTRPRAAKLLKQANNLILSGQPAAAEKLREHSQSLFLSLGVEGDGIILTSAGLYKGLKRLIKNTPNEDGTLGAYLREEHLDEFKVLNRQWASEIPLNKLWPLATHQFRRTFAVFMIRNGFGSFLQLKQQLGHLRLSMTIWYGRNAEMATALDMQLDEDIKAELDEVNAIFMLEDGEKIYLSDEPISGGAGATIRSQIAQGNIVFDSREKIEEALKSGELTIVDNGHSLCLNPNCSRLDCTIDTLISPMLCNYAVILNRHAQELAGLHTRLVERHKNAMKICINQPNLISKVLVGIRACEKTMIHHGIEFEPYDGLISIKDC